MWHWTMSHVWEVYLTATFWRDFSQTCFNSYLYTLLECKSNDFKNVILKNPYLLTRVEKQSKTRPSASCWIVSTLVSRYGFFNVTFLKSSDYLNVTCLSQFLVFKLSLHWKIWYSQFTSKTSRTILECTIPQFFGFILLLFHEFFITLVLLVRFSKLLHF